MPHTSWVTPLARCVAAITRHATSRHIAPTSEPVAEGVPADAQRVTVVNVTDGDTINVQPETDEPLAANTAHTIRLLLVDTPDTVHPSQPVACYGPEASQFVTDRLLGETVRL